MNKIFSLVLTLILLLTIGTPAKAQNYREAAEFVKQFRQTQESLPRESVYLHTDRDWYFFGDRIWFSAYVVTGGYNLLADISSVLYVELVRPDGKIAKRVTIEIVEGRGEGSLDFEEVKEAAGDYKIRSYTKWGKQFGASYVFEKNIKVLTGEEIEMPEESEAVTDLQFFPEGGDLIAGVESRLGFKAIGTDGLGKEIRGSIKNGMGQTVIDFRTSWKGMGVIPLRPEAGETYYADLNGEQIPLPEVRAQGARLSVEQDDEQFIVDIQSAGAYTGKTLLLFAHVRGLVFHAELANMEEGKLTLPIQKDKFPTGIVHFVLMDGKDPLSERLAFNKNAVDELNLDLEMDQQEYFRREKGDLRLQFSEQRSEPISGTASVSIFDDETQEYDEYRQNIRTRFYLGAEIKGYIEDPGYYFSGDDMADQRLDLLLLTQGWRAFDMTDPITTNDTQFMQSPERGFSVSGKVRSLFMGRPLKNAPVFVAFGDGLQNPKVVTTDNRGNFFIDNIAIYGEQTITVRANDSEGSDDLQLALDPQFAGMENEIDPVEQDLIFKGLDQQENAMADQGSVDSAIDPKEIQQRSEDVKRSSEQFVDVQMSGELDEVEVVGETISQSWSDKIFSDLGGGGTRINMDERKVLRDLSMDQVLNQLPGVRVNTVLNTVTLTRSSGTLQDEAPPPLILMDGQEVQYDFIRTLNTMDVKTITVAQSAADLAIFGSRGAGGAIIIETRSGDEGLTQERVRGLEEVTFNGYQSPTRFYMPRYGVNVPEDLDTPDKRITLYWNPDVNITEAGLEIGVWMNDVPSTYRVVVEGITENGEPFVGTTTFSMTE